MVKENRNIDKEEIYQSNGEILKNNMKMVEGYSYAVLLGLIFSIILLSFDLRLIAGILIIASTSLGILLIRKGSALVKKAGESFKDASSLNLRKDDVITDFSHRIREPLNNIVIITDMLLESGLQQKQKELLETFVASANNMVNIVNDLTMQSAGNLSYETRKHFKFNLLSTIQNTIELYCQKEKANIDFILNKKEFSDFECYGDPIILKQIFLDLFNTIEDQNFDTTTKVTINLKKEKEAGNESFIGLRIQIDKNIVLIDESNKKGSLAAKLISVGKGIYNQEFGKDVTVLNISLPFTNPVPPPKQQIASSRIEALIKKDKIHKVMKDIKILLVEDNLINQRIILLTLKSLVNCIDTASNGKEALDKFGTANYDIILLDIQMPVMSGLLAAEKIRALEASTSSHVPIIAITANAMLGDKEKCIASGIDDYISKPFQPSALIEKISKHL
jgi:CheY-like chemotaxis protein